MLTRDTNNISIDSSLASGATVYECAALSSDVYMDKMRPPLPPGWTQYKHKEYPSGFAGACYIKNENTPSHIVFAHRGTFNFNDILEDLNIVQEKFPYSHYESAINFFNEVCNELSKKYSSKELNEVQFTLTGHSLGGLLAELIGLCGNWWPTITFENPGSKPIVKKYYRNQGIPEDRISDILGILANTCHTYHAGVNIINTCNEQVGRTFRIKDMAYDYYRWDKGPYFPITTSYKFNPFYLIGNTTDQHRIEPIVNKLKTGNVSFEEIQNPIGFNAGYIEYLDQKNEKYWEDYFTIIWNKYPGLQDEYENDIDKFLNFCYAQLKRTQEEARASLSSTAKSETYNNQSVMFKQNKSVDDALNEFVILEKNDEIALEKGSRSFKCSMV